MKKYPILVLVLVLALVVVAIPVAAFAGQGQPNKQVPLAGDFAGVGAEFSGNFSHLGRFEGLVTGANPTTATWTAANGDTVTNETTSFELVGGEFPVFQYEQTIVITGGTGRFFDASGGATVTGTIDLFSNEYDGHLVGTISQPGPRE